MVFNGQTDGQDICTLADTLADYQNDTTFPLAEKALYANWGMRKIWAAIYRCYGGWILDDKNQTDLPELTADLSLNQYYGLPEAESLYSVDFMDASGTWNPLKPITIEDMSMRGYAESEFMKTAGTPVYYRPIGGGFKVYPASDTARALAIRIKINRNIVPFTSTTEAVEPGFDSLFHEAVALYMALEYAKLHSLAVAGGTMRGGFKTGLLGDWYDTLDEITKHYQLKFRQMFPPKFKKRRNMAGHYL